MPQANTKNYSNVIMYILLALLVFSLVIWVYSILEFRTIKEDKGYQGEAASNPYLAAEFFLRRMGQKTVRINLFTNKQTQLMPGDTLMVPNVRLAFDTRRSDEMLEWVEQGGHLIITGRVDAESEVGHRDYILESLGLFIERQSLNDELSQENEPVNTEIYDENEFWQVDFDDYLVISTTSEFNSEVIWTIKDSDRNHGLQVTFGSGRITLLSEMRIFMNDYIDSYDHAAFLLTLANDQLISGNDGVFYYTVYDDQISFFQWLWKNARALVLSTALLIFIWLWKVVPRFGPLINVHKPIRRQFIDHLKASGNYHWRQGHYHCLLTEVRKQLSHRVKIKYPEWSSKSKQDQISHFVELSQLESSAIEKALFNTEVERVNDFINLIKVLEKLRKSL